jgi:hypothetical protein
MLYDFTQAITWLVLLLNLHLELAMQRKYYSLQAPTHKSVGWFSIQSSATFIMDQREYTYCYIVTYSDSLKPASLQGW